MSALTNIENYIKQLAALDVPSISDAMDKLGIPSGLLGIKPVLRGNSICGPAFTVHYVPCGMNKGTVGNFLDQVQPGQVVVIDNGGRTWCTVWGDIMTSVAVSKKIGGTVIDGVCRDINGIEQYQYPIYTKGYYMVTGKERVQVDAVNEPVSISDVQVRPNDLVRGDDSGVVIVPIEHVEEIIQSAQFIEQSEEKIIQYVHAGHTLHEARAKMHYFSLQSKV